MEPNYLLGVPCQKVVTDQFRNVKQLQLKTEIAEPKNFFQSVKRLVTSAISDKRAFRVSFTVIYANTSTSESKINVLDE